MGGGLGAHAAGILVAVVLVVPVVIGIRRFVSGKAARARRDAENGESFGAGMFGELIEVLQPSRKHLTEEQERQRLDIVQRPAEGRPFDVDLDTGVFYVPSAQETRAPDPVPDDER